MVMDDPPNDVTLGAGAASSPSLPAAERIPYLDLTQVQFRDLDESTLELRLRNQAGFKLFQDATAIFGGEEASFDVFFSVPGSTGGSAPILVSVESFHYRTESNVPQTDWVVAGARLCLPRPGPSGTCDFFASEFLSHDIVDGELVIPIPKLMLTQQGHDAPGAGAAALAPRLSAGDLVSEVWARGISRANPYFTVSVGGSEGAELVDRVPDTGFGSFPLAYPTSTDDLRITWPQSGLVAGEPNVLAVQVENLAPAKRIVNFSLEMQRSSTDQPWTYALTPQVTLGAHRAANLTLRVEPPALGDAGRVWALFRIRADVITQPGTVALSDQGVVASDPLDLDHGRFYVHGGYVDFSGTELPTLFKFGSGWLSRVADDPDSPEQPIKMYPTGFFVAPGFPVELRLPLYSADGIPNPARLRPDEPISFAFELTSTIPLDGELEIQAHVGDEVVASHRGPVSLATSSSVVQGELKTLPTFTGFDPENGSLRLDVYFRKSGADANAFGALFLMGLAEVTVTPTKSWVDFPVERVFPLVPAEVPYDVALAPAEDLDAFINPGRTQVFEFDLRNEDDVRVRVDVAAENVSREDWSADILPGTRYGLEPGGSARLGVVVAAPNSAKEAEVMRFQVTARDVDNRSLLSSASVRLITTSGVDIDNETFVPTDQDLGALEKRPRGSPAPSGALVAALGAAALLLRRRRA